MDEISFLTRQEVKDLLRIKQTTLFRYMREGILPFYKLGEGKAGRVLFEKADVIAFIESRKSQIPPPPHKKPRKLKRRTK